MTWLPSHAIARLRESAGTPDFSGTRFRLVEMLGRGGMGAVWLARDEELCRDVAIKVPSEPLADEEAQARLLAEARVLARLEHPGIVPVHDAGVLPDGRAWYAMKRVVGRRLDEAAGAEAPLAERLRVFERLCETLAFAHAHGVVHRDLKPGNVMVGSFGEVLVLDWGVAKILGGPSAGARDAAAAPGGGTSPGTVLGTPGFMPPEHAEGRAHESDARADVWGLGAILCVMLSGSPPPQPLPPPGRRLAPGSPRALEAICRKALAHRPEDRYAGADDLRHDVAAFRDGHAVSARREGVLEAAARLVSRYRVPLGLVAAYLVMRLAIAFWLGR